MSPVSFLTTYSKNLMGYVQQRVFFKPNQSENGFANYLHKNQHAEIKALLI